MLWALAQSSVDATDLTRCFSSCVRVYVCVCTSTQSRESLDERVQCCLIYRLYQKTKGGKEMQKCQFAKVFGQLIEFKMCIFMD